MIVNDIVRMAIEHEREHGVKPSRVHLGRRQMDELRAVARRHCFYESAVAGDGAELPDSVNGLEIVKADADDQLAVAA